MWKHEILACSKIPAEIRGYLLDSTQFFFGDIDTFSSIRENHIKNNDIIIELFPPYNKTLLEFTAETKEKDPLKVAVLYVVKDSFSRIYAFIKQYSENSWYMCTKYAHIQERVGTTFHVYEDFSRLLNRLDINSRNAEDAASTNIIRSTWQNTMLLLEVLNARNIITRCKIPPEKLNKKRIKHRHAPYDKYYILEVVKGVPKEKYQGEVPWDYKSPENVAFHMCRGHFKTYTEDAPLFGKYAGTFWWQPQARGRVENGIITKDYSVAVNE